MNQLNKFLLQSYKPTLALIVYQNDESEWSKDAFYLESHQINETGQLLAGQPLQMDTITGMVNALKADHEQETRVSGFMPANVLSFAPGTAGDYSLSWYRPAGKRMMYFIDNPHLKSGFASVPAMLYVARASQLNVYTLASNRRPGKSSKVYPAPYPNVSSDGRVCLGSAKVKQPKQKTFENLIGYWEEMFWGSKFTHLNNATVASGLTKLWKAQLRKPDQPFPTDKLGPSTKTLEKILNGIK